MEQSKQPLFGLNPKPIRPTQSEPKKDPDQDSSQGLLPKPKKFPTSKFKPRPWKRRRRPSKSKRRRPSPIKPGDIIDYRNISLIGRFISQQGKILPRRVKRVTLKQQRDLTLSIKQARILSLLPYHATDKLFEIKRELTARKKRTKGFRKRNKK